MAAFAVRMNSKFGSGRRPKDHRRAFRKKVGSQAWIRLGGFAVRPCIVVDLSDTGVQITVGKTEMVSKTFTFRVGAPTLSGGTERKSVQNF